MVSAEVYEALGRPLPANIIKRDELVDLCNYLLAGKRIQDRLFAQNEGVIVKVPSGKYLATVAKLLARPVKKLSGSGYYNRLSVDYLGVQFVTYEPANGGNWTDTEVK